MKNLNDFNSKIEFVLTDIDDTLTTEGQLGSLAYESLWRLHDAGLKVIPITGRPAGWCEMIARFWPVEGIVGENGGFYFRYASAKATLTDLSRKMDQKKMQRWFFADEKTITENRHKLEKIKNEVLIAVPGSAIASDQFCRLMDLAIDFCEDVPALSKTDVDKIVSLFHKHNAQAKVSSIHVNGWFGEYDKLSTTLHFLKTEFGLNNEQALKKCIFVGDSPNDEPLFTKFPLSFGVANINNFKSQLKHLPAFVASKKGGEGFAEIVDQVLKVNN